MYIKRHKGVLTSAVLAGAAMLLVVGDAIAKDTLTTIGASWKLQINAVLGIAKLVMGMLGFFMFAGGLFYFYKDNKQPGQGHLKTGVVAMLVGTGLMIIPWLLGLFTETVASGQGTGAVTRSQGTTL
jgi:hypothetical protein